jgi:hypothetical protein
MRDFTKLAQIALARRLLKSTSLEIGSHREARGTVWLPRSLERLVASWSLSFPVSNSSKSTSWFSIQSSRANRASRGKINSWHENKTVIIYHENNAAFFIAFRPATNHHHGETVASTVGSAT